MEKVVVVSVATALASYSSLFPVMVLVPVFLHRRDTALSGQFIVPVCKFVFHEIYTNCYSLSVLMKYILFSYCTNIICYILALMEMYIIVNS